MNILTTEQYAEMLRRFPGIGGYINRCQLQNEYRSLVNNESTLNPWQKGRLSELRNYEVEFDRDFYNEAI